MFDLETAIAGWRRKMLNAGIKTPVPLDELESHLRDDMDQQVRSGLSEARAFAAAAQQIGQPRALKSEFRRVGGTAQEWIKHIILILSGLPNPQLATTMNRSFSNPHIEPAWATYVKAATFLAPALSLWAFSVVFLVPKLREIYSLAGLAFPVVFQVVFFLTQHWLVIGGALLLALAVLEWRSGRWPTCRKATVGIGVFVLNSAVLVFITTLFVLAMIAAPALLHHAG